MNVFLDTNVVIDFCVRREPFFNSAANIMDMAYRREINIIISSLTFVNVAYILRKAFPKDEMGGKLDSLAALSDIAPINKEIIKEAIRRRSRDFEDCVQCLSAMAANADIIVTRDKNGFTGLPIQAISPDDFVERCR